VFNRTFKKRERLEDSPERPVVMYRPPISNEELHRQSEELTKRSLEGKAALYPLSKLTFLCYRSGNICVRSSRSHCTTQAKELVTPYFAFEIRLRYDFYRTIIILADWLKYQ